MSTERDALPLPGLPARLVVVTPSRVSAWLDCPRRFRFRYVDRPPPAPGPPRAHVSLGLSVHAALSAWWRLDRRARTVPAAGQLLEGAWVDAGFRDERHSRIWRARSRVMVERYAAGLDPAREPVGVERTVGFPTPVMAASGRVDRIDDRDGSLVVVDFKTGAAVPGEDDARGSPALALYAVATARTLRRPCTRVELHHIPSGSVASHEHAPEALARHVQRIEAVAQELAAARARLQAGEPVDAAYPPRPGPVCGWCDQRQACPEGRLAAPARQPWDGLPGEPEEDGVPGGAGPAVEEEMLV